ncbi:MAG: hypothetical protein MPK62_00205 [Alphaproteobacteria bacterium]|nr:hypothetical protein [Alphaproteobacteria bacterium]MDA8029559.1 hypothetical protein [Alphaproteobacteria bacterium]
MQEILGGVVAVIAIAITIGVGTSILGSSNSAFDCSTLDGYTGPVTTGVPGAAYTETKRTTDGTRNYDIRLSHEAFPLGTAVGDVSVRISNVTDGKNVRGVQVEFNIGGVTFNVEARDGVSTFPTRLAGVSTPFGISVTQDRLGTLATPATASFTIVTGSTATTSESYTGWAKACQDAQRQTTQAWTLIPIILIVIVAAIIITVLRGFYGSTG